MFMLQLDRGLNSTSTFTLVLPSGENPTKTQCREIQVPQWT